MEEETKGRTQRWVSFVGKMTKGACGDKGEEKTMMYKSKGMMRGRIQMLHKESRDQEEDSR